MIFPFLKMLLLIVKQKNKNNKKHNKRKKHQVPIQMKIILKINQILN